MKTGDAPRRHKDGSIATEYYLESGHAERGHVLRDAGTQVARRTKTLSHAATALVSVVRPHGGRH